MNKDKEPMSSTKVAMPSMVNQSNVHRLKQQFDQMPAEEISEFLKEALKADEDENGIPDIIEQGKGQFTIQDILAVVHAMKHDDDPTNNKKADLITKVLETEGKANTKLGGVILALERLPVFYWMPYNPERMKDCEEKKGAKQIVVTHRFKFF